MSNELDRMLADNQNSTRMNQLKQIAKVTAEIALLAVSSGSSATLKKAASSLKPALSTGAKAGYDTLGKRVLDKAKLVLKEGSKKLVPTLNKGAESLDRAAAEFGKNKVKNEVTNKVKEQLPEETLTAFEKLQQGFTTSKSTITSLKGAFTGGANEKINAASQVVFGEADLTHGAIGYAAKVLKTAEGKPSNYALKVIEGGQKQLNHMIGQTTRDLLKDTKAMLKSAEEDAEADAENEERSKEAIKRMRKA